MHKSVAMYTTTSMASMSGLSFMEAEERARKPRQPIVIYNLALCATVGGALFGYNTAILNGAHMLIEEEFKLSKSWMEHILSSTIGAAAVFSLIAGMVADAIGRKTTIMLSAVGFTIGGVVMGVAGGPIMLLIGRILTGAAIGIVSTVVPIYVAECSPTSIRGCLTVMNQLFITIGIGLASLSVVLFHEKTYGWRYMLGIAAIPGIFQFLFFLGLPESPRYQVMANKLDKAQAILEKIRESGDVIAELNDIIVSMEDERDKTGIRAWRYIFTTPHIRYALFVGCMLHMFQQFCGINTVIYYSANILKSAGFDVKKAIWLSAVPSTVNFLATFIGLWAVEALGRRRVLVSSYFGIAVSLMFLVSAFVPAYLDPVSTSAYYEVNVPKGGHCDQYKNCWQCTHDELCGFCGMEEGTDSVFNASCILASPGRDIELYASIGRCSINNKTNTFKGGKEMVYTYGYCPTVFAWLAVAGLIFFVFGFAPGAGPVTWTLTAEIYPLWCRSKASSLAAFVNWGCNYVVSFYFLDLAKSVTIWGAFLLFSVVCVLAALFVMAMVPETKDYYLEEIELLFMSTQKRKDAITRLQNHAETVGYRNISSPSMAGVPIVQDYSSYVRLPDYKASSLRNVS